MGTKPRRVYFLFKVINQEKKKGYRTITFRLSLKVPYHICFEKCNKKDRSQCLLKIYNGPNLPRLCLNWHWSRALFHQLTANFAVAGSKGFQNSNKNILIGRKSRAYETIWYVFWVEIKEFLNGIDSKRSSSRYCQGHYLHNRVTCFVNTICSLFFFLRFFISISPI